MFLALLSFSRALAAPVGDTPLPIETIYGIDVKKTPPPKKKNIKI